MTISLDGFLDSIAAAPDDDAPRLVFADWLEDEGDPTYAEFIRVQCELARFYEADRRFIESWASNVAASHVEDDWRQREGASERLALQRREAELFDVLSRRWQRQLQDGVPEGLWLRNFQRGFIDTVELTIVPAVLVECTGRWPFLLRIERLDVGEQVCDGFFGCTELARVKQIACVRWGLEDSAMLPFATAEHFHNLQMLDLSGCTFGQEGIAAFARCPSLTGLRKLNLGWVVIGDAGLITLVGSPVCRCLTWLNVYGNEITDAGARALASSPHLTNLRALALCGNQISRAGYRAIRESPNLPSLEMLDLDGEFANEE